MEPSAEALSWTASMDARNIPGNGLRRLELARLARPPRSTRRSIRVQQYQCRTSFGGVPVLRRDSYGFIRCVRDRILERGPVVLLTLMVNIIGATNGKTPNALVLDSGQASNVRCGADILLTGLYHDLNAEAVCPICRSKIEVRIEGGKAASVRPQSALLHYVVDDESRFSVCCSGTFLFDRKQCLSDWLGSYEGPKGTVVSPQTFMDEATARRGDR